MAERLPAHHEVSLISRDAADVPTLERTFGVSLANIHFLWLEVPDTHSAWHTLAQRLPRHFADIVNEFPAYRKIRALKLDLFIHNFSRQYMKCPAPRGIFTCAFAYPLPTFPKVRWGKWPVLKQLRMLV